MISGGTEAVKREMGLISDIVSYTHKESDGEAPATMGEIAERANRYNLAKEHFTVPEMGIAFETFLSRTELHNDPDAMAGAMRDAVKKAGLNPLTIEAMMQETNFPRSSVTEKRIKTIASEGRARQFDANWGDRKVRELSDDQLEAAYGEMKALKAADANGESDDFFVPLSQKPMKTKAELEEGDLFAEGWLKRRQAAMIVSTAGTGKSVMSYQLAYAWACGREALGLKPMRPLRIAILQAEDDESEVAEFRRSVRVASKVLWKWTDADIRAAEDNLHDKIIPGCDVVSFVGRLRELLKRCRDRGRPIDLVIVNPLQSVTVGNDLTSNTDTGKILRNDKTGFDSIIKDETLNCSMLFFHHTPKQLYVKGQPRPENNPNAKYLAAGCATIVDWIRAMILLVEDPKGAMEKKAGRSFKFIAAKRRPRSWPENPGGNPYLVLYHAPKEAEVVFWLKGRGELEEMNGNAAKIAEMKRREDLGETAEPPETPPETPPADPPAGSLEDDVRRLAEELAKSDSTSLTEARDIAHELLGNKRGNAAHGEITQRLKDQNCNAMKRYGLKMVKDSKFPAKKLIVKEIN